LYIDKIAYITLTIKRLRCIVRASVVAL